MTEINFDLNNDLNDVEDLYQALSTITQLYTDKTHLVYELLQNAEDCRASRVRFLMFLDKLEFWHDGEPFTQENITALRSVAKSVKSDSINAIGKFGVGFKSVFSICEEVHIFSEPDNFANRLPEINLENKLTYMPRFANRIEKFRWRSTIEFASHLDKPYTTRFVFPFAMQNEDKKYLGYKSIIELRGALQKKLCELGADVMLFLKRIKKIEYSIYGKSGQIETRGSYRLERERIDNGIYKIRAIGSSLEESSYIRYSKRLSSLHKNRSIDFVFSIDDSGDIPRFINIGTRHRNIYVYFPTETESKLNFLIQAPFATTPNRGGVPVDENVDLAKVAADLLRFVICDVKQRGWLTLDFLNLLPLSLPIEGWLFKPLYDTAVEMMRSEPILPTIDGDFTLASNANIARREILTKLVNNKTLNRLLKNESAVWLPTELTETNRTLSPLYNFLIGVLKVPIRRPDDLPQLFRANEDFLKGVDDNWLESFYNFLSKELDTTLLGRDFAITPFIKMADGSFRAPFNVIGHERHINVYIRPENLSTSMFDNDFIASFIAKNCENFVKRLGISEPDGYSFLQKELKSIYENAIISNEQNIGHVKRALRFISENRHGIVEILKKYLYLYCRTPGGDSIYVECENNSIYFMNDLNGVSIYEYYNDTDTDVYILDEDHYNEYGISKNELQGLKKIGVLDSVYDYGLQTWAEGTHNAICKNDGDFKRDLTIDNIDSVIKYIQKNSQTERAKSKSHIMLELIKNVSHMLSGSWVYGQTTPKYIEDVSILVSTLSKEKWVFSITGELCMPGELSKFELSDDIYGAIDAESNIYNILGFEHKDIDDDYQMSSDFSRIPRDQLVKHIQLLPKTEKDEILRELISVEEESDEFDPDVVEEYRIFPIRSAPENKERFREVMRTRYIHAPLVQYEYKIRSIRTSKEEDRQYIRNHYQGFCQMCGCHTMYWQIAELLPKPKKELAHLNLSFCRNCAAKYQAFRRNDRLMDDFTDAMINENLIGNLTIVLADEVIRFTALHLAEIQELLKYQQAVND